MSRSSILRGGETRPFRPGEHVLEAVGVQKIYEMGGTGLHVLKSVSFRVGKGETVSIMGASGAGKTTLLNVLGALDRPTQGKVFLNGTDLYDMSNAARAEVRARRLGFVFQFYHLLPELDIAENVMLPALAQRGGVRNAYLHRKRAMKLLDRVGLGERAHHRPDELSGGEQQRAALARALMNEPEIILADEPTGNLDSATGELVLRYLFEMVSERGHTLVVVSHNETIASRCDRMLRLHDGKLV